MSKHKNESITLLPNGVRLVQTKTEGKTTTRFEHPTSETNSRIKGSNDRDWLKDREWYQDLTRNIGDTKTDAKDSKSPSSSGTPLTGGGSGYQPRPSYSEPYVSSYQSSYQSKPDVGIVKVVDDKGTVIAERTVEHWNADVWAKLLIHYKLDIAGSGLPFIRVPESAVSLSEDSLKFYACTYTAAERYMESRWGRRLDDTDKNWLAAHPLATDDGIPMEYTMTAIGELLEPYGFAISRARIRAKAFIAGDEPMKWMMALGCNPLAMVDHNTTNAEYAAKTGMPLEQVNTLFRLEFHKDPLPMSIVGEKGWSSAVKTGNQGGHARYLPPRDRAGDWLVSLQLAPSEQVAPYMKAPTPTPYIRRRGKLSFYLSSVKAPDGSLIDTPSSGGNGGKTQQGEFFLGGKKEEKGEEKATSGPASPEALSPDKSLNFTMKCEVCEKDVSPLDLEDGSLVCVSCWADAWSHYYCSKCKTQFNHELYPTVVQGMQEIEVECPTHTCRSRLSFGGDKKLVALRKSVEHYLAYLNEP